MVLARKTATLGQELQVSVGPRPHLWIFACKTACLEQNYKSLWVPDLNCGYSIQNSDFTTRITSLSVTQTSPVDFCMQKIALSIRFTSLYGSQTSSLVFCKQNRVLRTKITSLYGSQTSPVDLSIQNSVFSTRITSL